MSTPTIITLYDTTGQHVNLKTSDIVLPGPQEVVFTNSAQVPAYAYYTLTKANILAMATGTGIEVVAAPGANKFIQFLGAMLFVNFDTAAYTAGGNVTVRYTQNTTPTTLSTLVAAADSFGAAADRVWAMSALSTASLGGLASTFLNTGLSIISSGAFTDPGTAAGTGVIAVSYRVHSTF